MAIAATIRSEVERTRSGTFFCAGDFPGPRPAVETALSRLTAEGSLRRVRRGLYWKGVKSRFGPGRPRVEDVVREIADDRGLGPTGWSASHALGLSTQVPATPEFVVVGPTPTGIPGVVFHSRRNFARLGLKYLEIALLELLRAWPDFVETGWEDLMRSVRRLRGEGAIRLERIARAASSERSPSLRKRLDALLSELEEETSPGLVASSG
jgi:hypothetical protein